MTTEQKGQIAVLKVQIEAEKKRARVFLPTKQDRADMVLDYRGKLYRAQVKYADGKSPRSQGCFRLDLRRRKRRYTSDEIDVLLVYIPQIDKVCWFGPEVFHNKPCLQLRLQPTKNGQQKGCRMVEDYIW